MEGGAESAAGLSVQRDADTLELRLDGAWKLGRRLPSAGEAFGAVQAADRRVAFDTTGLTAWDSGLVAFAVQLVGLAREREVEVDLAGLPDGARRLLELALAVPEVDAKRGPPARPSLLRWVGEGTLGAVSGAVEIVRFIGELTLSLLRLVTGRAGFRGGDLGLVVQDTGARALGIVSLISFLVGLILAYIGAVQFQTFGAEIYVANLVGIAMAREMAAIMTGIIMAGRTGAAFAAQLGTMTVGEEIDALQTLGISPIDFLVLPRVLALVLMMPLLTVYSNLLGILGGLVVGVSFGIPPSLYWTQTLDSVSLTDFAVGIFKGGVFGVIVALSGCLRGMQCGRSASAVGQATTSAVVSAIVAIIVADAVFAVLFSALGI